MGRPRKKQDASVSGAVHLIEIMARNPRVGFNAALREVDRPFSRNEALRIWRAVRAVLAAAGVDGVEVAPKPRDGNGRYRNSQSVPLDGEAS